jgi:hypothetical protein
VETKKFFALTVNQPPPHCPSVITCQLTLAHPLALRLVKSEVSIAMKINIAVFWGRGVVNFSEISSASIFRVEELAGSSTKVFTVPYFTLCLSTEVTCTSGFFPLAHCSDEVPLFPTAKND